MTADAAADRSWKGAALPRLAAYRRVATHDVDEAAEQIGRIFCPHGLQPKAETARDFLALHNCAAFDGFSINYVEYGGVVTIDPGCLDRFFLVQLPFAGAASVHTASREVATEPNSAASLLSPTMPTRMVWDNCAQLILLLDRRMVEQRAAALSGRSVQPIEFDPAIALSAERGSRLRAHMLALAELAESLAGEGRLSAVAAADWRETLLDILFQQPSGGLSEAIRLHSGKSDALPKAVRRARDLLAAQATEPLDLSELAAAAGVGIRALQGGFRRHFGMSISDMLLDIRLARLNAQLLTASPEARIIDLAFELGFTHLGRMAGAYRDKFGEPPSATLQRVQRGRFTN
ncbi:putative transcriptional regulator, AraC/XylS family [Bradyrhizobium sp. ORS 285]|uniref:AraC family transcriptional regulator n=1 Tax=Bradyrhizobium sp. ORS 285 TaxID=115808 RepID=UPI0002405CA6|nr:AraC family transcriptional regulator [Bradyrhizobium sp. ORS 285]CCD88879.1 putative transcriptional regulator, AraC/XylS family [Bradyrhizobium sp. ORS 285]SMX56721.1 putative transcriptional regulator, AraC/XylS family [Bradyrhizobium sp. ORS 285]